MHEDALGNKLAKGDYVAYSSHNHLRIGIVYKLTPKMVFVIPAGRQYWDRKYPNDVVQLNDPKLSLYMLKHSK